MRRATLISIAVFCVLLVLVLVQAGSRMERGMRRMDFSGIESEAVQAIHISGAKPVKLERKDGVWFIEGRPANANSVKVVLDSLGRMNSSELVSEGASNLAELGLDKAQAQHVEILGDKGTLAAFKVGKSAGGGAYIQVDDGVFLVKGVFPRSFARKLSDWHDLKFFAAKLDELKRVEWVPAHGRGFVLERKEGTWHLAEGEAPEGFRLDSAAARRWAGAIVNARAGEILLDDTDEKKAGLDEKFDRYLFETEGGEKGELHIGAAHGEHDVYARVAGRQDIFVLREYSLKALRKKLADLRAMNPLVFDASGVRRLDIQDGKKRLVLAREGEDWKVEQSSQTAPAGFSLEKLMVEGRLRALAGLKGLRLADAAPATDTATITLGLEGDKSIVLRFGAEQKEGEQILRPVQGNADTAVYLLPKDRADRVLGMLDSFKKPDLPPGAQPGGMPRGLNPQTLQQLPPEVRAKIMQQLGQGQR